MTPLEQGGLTVFLFILPLAFTLTAFLMWISKTFLSRGTGPTVETRLAIVWSLNSTIADLGMRKQAYKKSSTIFSRSPIRLLVS